MASDHHQLMLDIPEILENALAHLPRRQLHLCQRVCRQWAECIRTSPTVRRRLSPGLDYPVVPNKFSSKDMAMLPKHDPLLKHALPNVRLRSWVSQPTEAGIRVRPSRAALSISANVPYSDIIGCEATQYRESWRDIHLTAPRLQSLTIMIEDTPCRYGTTIASKKEVFCETGLTFGQVFDAMMAMSKDIEVDTESGGVLKMGEGVRYDEHIPAWLDPSVDEILLSHGEQFDHLLEPCTMPKCSQWLPVWERQSRWVNTDRFDIYKMIHMFYHHEDNWEWNHFNDRKYIDVDGELVVERHDTRELRFDLFLN